MLSKCVNPACANTFRYSREGKLYVTDPKARSGHFRVLEYFWLCSTCCRDMTIQIDHGHAVTVCREKAIHSDLPTPRLIRRYCRYHRPIDSPACFWLNRNWRHHLTSSEEE